MSLHHNVKQKKENLGKITNISFLDDSVVRYNLQ